MDEYAKGGIVEADEEMASKLREGIDHIGTVPLWSTGALRSFAKAIEAACMECEEAAKAADRVAKRLGNG